MEGSGTGANLEHTLLGVHRTALDCSTVYNVSDPSRGRPISVWSASPSRVRSRGRGRNGVFVSGVWPDLGPEAIRNRCQLYLLQYMRDQAEVAQGASLPVRDSPDARSAGSVRTVIREVEEPVP